MHLSRVLSILLCLVAVVQITAQRIAVLNDLHVSPGNKNDSVLQVAIADINTKNFDCVVVNGDLTNEGSDHELSNMHHRLSAIMHPQYVVPGNHENNWSQSATKTFLDLWGNDRFAARIGDIVIVGINCGPYMKMGDGHIKQEDLHWLKATLDSMVTDGTRVISFNHYPIRKDDLDNYMEYCSLLEQYPVIVHINGHYHNYDRYMAGDIDAVMTRALYHDNSYGYSIIEVEGDQLVIYEQILGCAPVERYRIDCRTEHKPVTEALSQTSPLPPEIRCVYADSASVFTRLAFDGDNVYFGTSLGDAKAVRKADGTKVWSVPLGYPLFARATNLNNGKIAFPNTTGIAIVDAATGCLVETLPSTDGPYVADGILYDGKYIQGGYGRIECRDADNCRIIWSYDSINNYCQAAPVADKGQLVFGAWDTYLRCIDINDGSLLWQWSNGRSNNLFSPGNVVPALTDSVVIIVAPDRYMTAIDRSTGATLWRDNTHKYRESMGQSADGKTVYAKTMDGKLVAVAADGSAFTELWVCDLGLGYEHAPCVVAESDGVIYVGSRRGIVTAVSADTHEVLWQHTLGSSEVNGIDIDPTDGSVWVSLIEGRIYATRSGASAYAAPVGSACQRQLH